MTEETLSSLYKEPIEVNEILRPSYFLPKITNKYTQFTDKVQMANKHMKMQTKNAN